MGFADSFVRDGLLGTACLNGVTGVRQFGGLILKKHHVFKDLSCS